MKSLLVHHGLFNAFAKFWATENHVRDVDVVFVVYEALSNTVSD